MRRILFGLIFIFLFSNLSASCSDGQIDINSASVSELDELYGIGEVKAQAIVDARPFDCVDDLINVYGIGEATLEKIKSQGLACVEEEEDSETENSEEVEENSEDEDEEEDEKEEDEEEERDDDKEQEEVKEYEVIEEIEEDSQVKVYEVINLTPKEIKTEKGSEKLTSQDYATYGLGGFCVLLGFLFGIKVFQDRRYKKNEFN